MNYLCGIRNIVFIHLMMYFDHKDGTESMFCARAVKGLMMSFLRGDPIV